MPGRARDLSGVRYADPVAYLVRPTGVLVLSRLKGLLYSACGGSRCLGCGRPWPRRHHRRRGQQLLVNGDVPAVGLADVFVIRPGVVATARPGVRMNHANNRAAEPIPEQAMMKSWYWVSVSW